MQLTKYFADAKERTGFSILSLIPPINRRGDTPEDSSLCNAELLFGEALENLTKVDTTININATLLLQTGLLVCTNTVLLCCTFAQVQCTLDVDTNSHPIPFFFTTAMKLRNSITSQLLQDAISGHSEQALFVSYTVLACLNTITTCIRKEASNPDML